MAVHCKTDRGFRRVPSRPVSSGGADIFQVNDGSVITDQRRIPAAWFSLVGQLLEPGGVPGHTAVT